MATYDQGFFDWLNGQGFQPGSTTLGSATLPGYRQGNTFYPQHEMDRLYQGYQGRQATQNLLQYIQDMATRANDETMQDRQRVLDEIERYRSESQLDYAGIEQRAVAETRAQGAEIMRQLVERQQQLGRTANPYVMAGISARLSAAGRDDLNQLRTQLAQQRGQTQLNVTELIHNVMQNTQRNTLSPQVLFQMLQLLGQGGANGLQALLRSLGGR